MEFVPVFLRLIHGRCGSTMLMQLLSSGENVIVDSDYPYENRYLSYLYRAAEVIGLDPSSDWDNDDLMSSHCKLLGPIPYKEIEIFDKNRLASSVFNRLLNAFFDELYKHNANRLKGFDTAFYPEKSFQQAAVIINRKRYSKNIFLVRDPRDIFISIKGFNKKRGNLGFGWEDGQTDKEFAKSLCVRLKDFLNHYNSIPEDDRRIKVKYEQLLTDPITESERLSEWLGTRLSYDFVLANMKAISQHITAKEGLPVIDRWHNEMAQDLLAIFSDNIGKEMALAGYSDW